jgi:hypothetical protein
LPTPDGAAVAALANPSVVAVKPPITATARVNVFVIEPLLRGGQIWLFRKGASDEG